GAPEVILFTWVLTGAVCAYQWLSTPEHRWRKASRILLVILFIGALCAVQLLPFFDLLLHSQRDSNSDSSSSWSMPPWGWANLLVPLFWTSRTSMGVFLQPDQGWTSSYYLGITTLIIALATVWKVRRPFVWILGGILALSLVLALGRSGYLYSWV